MSSFEQNLLGGAKNWVTNKGADLISGIKNEGNANQQRTGGMQRFLTELQSAGGLYRNVFFEIYIHGLRDINSEYSMNLLCHQASLPGFRLETKDNVIYTLPYETPVGVVFDPAWFTFYIDNSFTVNNAIYSSTFNTTSGIGRINPTNWSPKYRDPSTLLTLEIVAFSPDIQNGTTYPNTSGESKTWDGLPVLARYTLHNCFFKTVQQTPLDWGAHNDLSSVTAEVSYEWFDAQYPAVGSYLQTNSITSAPAPVNFETIINKYPALGVAYDAAKRTVINNQSILNNPVLNAGSQFLP